MVQTFSLLTLGRCRSKQNGEIRGKSAWKSASRRTVTVDTNRLAANAIRVVDTAQGRWEDPWTCVVSRHCRLHLIEGEDAVWAHRVRELAPLGEVETEHFGGTSEEWRKECARACQHKLHEAPVRRHGGRESSDRSTLARRGLATSCTDPGR